MAWKPPTVDECLRFIGHGFFDFSGPVEGGYVRKVQNFPMIRTHAFLIIENLEDEQDANEAIKNLIYSTSDAFGIAGLLTNNRNIRWGGNAATALVFVYNAKTRDIRVVTLETALKIAGGKKITIAGLMNNTPYMNRGVARVHSGNAQLARRELALTNCPRRRRQLEEEIRTSNRAEENRRNRLRNRRGR